MQRLVPILYTPKHPSSINNGKCNTLANNQEDSVLFKRKERVPYDVVTAGHSYTAGGNGLQNHLLNVVGSLRREPFTSMCGWLM